MTIKGNGDTKKNFRRRRGKVSLVWVSGITGNEMADIEAKIILYDVIHPTETYPPQDLAKWLTTKAIESRNLKWKESFIEMKERKSNPEWTKHTEGLGRKNQVIITRIRSGYTRSTRS
jgi:hypothetical protein